MSYSRGKQGILYIGLTARQIIGIVFSSDIAIADTVSISLYSPHCKLAIQYLSEQAHDKKLHSKNWNAKLTFKRAEEWPLFLHVAFHISFNKCWIQLDKMLYTVCIKIKVIHFQRPIVL